MAQYISNKAFYKKSLKAYGVSAQGVHWKNQESQYKRFDIITSFIEDKIENSTVSDVGCGLAEYYNYLKNKEKLPLKYTGIDCEDIMVRASRKRFPELEIQLKNVLYDDIEQTDYAICSGAMNLMNYDQCCLFIKRVYKGVKKGFVFNFLQSLTFNGVQPYEILSCCESLCDNIEFKEGYLDNDFTIFMVK